MDEEPAESPSGPVIDQDTLDALWGAYGVCTGAVSAPAGGDTPDAMGLILAYLPGLLDLVAKLIDPEGKITHSAHTIL